MSTDTRLTALAAEIADWRGEHINDMRDVVWYVSEQGGLDEYEAGVVVALVAAALGVTA